MTKVINMTDIPNTEYITIKSDGIFVGGKRATHYRGVEIGYRKSIKKNFQTIQNQYPNIQEIRFLTSKTGGEYLAVGNPDTENGSNAWACVKFKDGYVAPWVLVCRDYTYDFIVAHMICGNLYNMGDNYVFLHPLLGKYQDVTIRINLQNMAGKSFELNGYRLTVEQITQQQR